MSKYLKRSRILKAMADAARVRSFEEAETRLDAVRLDVVIGQDQVETPAGQAAALTAVATAFKCFGGVTVIAQQDAELIAPLPIGSTLIEAARSLGASVAVNARDNASHTIRIGTSVKGAGWEICCWWDRWLSGTRSFSDDMPRDSRLAIAGVFAAATAVRQVFACVLAGRNVPGRDISVSLWTPWEPVDHIAKGPARFDVPDKLWLAGLGHLGQAFVWNLCFLAAKGERFVTLQDDQTISEENEGTGLLVLPGEGKKGERKTRIGARWLEACGWITQLIERRHLGDIELTEKDAPYLLSGLDSVAPRLVLARHGFPYMLDTGLGQGPGDFEGIQIRTIARGQSIDGLWEKPRDENKKKTDKLLESAVYKELEQHVGTCGKFEFAEASVAVPFVGAAAGALTIAQLIRLASLECSPLLMQTGLGALDMTTLGGLVPAPESNLGSFSIRL
jgi:hypothetical protein